MREAIYALLGAKLPQSECPTCKNALDKTDKCENKKCKDYYFVKFNWCPKCEVMVRDHHMCGEKHACLNYRIYVVIDGVRNYHVVNRTMGFDVMLQSPQDFAQKYWKHKPKWGETRFFESEVTEYPDSTNCGDGFNLMLSIMKMIRAGEYVHRGTWYKGKPNFTEIGMELNWQYKSVPTQYR